MGTEQRGGNRSRLCKPAGKKEKAAEEVGREEEGSSSNRPELAAFVMALRSTPVTTVKEG